jgi:transcriptional regulator with XRE-family HTH domain
MKPDVLHVFGARLREVRTARGMSQEELAFAAKLHRTYVGGIERGTRNPSLSNVVRLAKALRMTPSELLEGVR